jgi:hypothetical protein
MVMASAFVHMHDRTGATKRVTTSYTLARNDAGAHTAEAALPQGSSPENLPLSTIHAFASGRQPKNAADPTAPRGVVKWLTTRYSCTLRLRRRGQSS